MIHFFDNDDDDGYPPSWVIEDDSGMILAEDLHDPEPALTYARKLGEPVYVMFMDAYSIYTSPTYKVTSRGDIYRSNGDGWKKVSDIGE